MDILEGDGFLSLTYPLLHPNTLVLICNILWISQSIGD